MIEIIYDIIMCILCFLVFAKYAFVIHKYQKTGKFKKKKYKSNISEIIAYSFFTTLIILFLISMILVSKNKFNDLIAILIFISTLGTFITYPLSWLVNSSNNKHEAYITNRKEFINKYGNKKYDEFEIECAYIPDNISLDEHFSALIKIITNNQISFTPPNSYKNIVDVFEYLYEQDYIKLLHENISITLNCENINSLLKKNKIDFIINQTDITKYDDEHIKARRKDFIPTGVYDLCKIDETIKRNLNDYRLLAIILNDEESNIEYPRYLCIIKNIFLFERI